MADNEKTVILVFSTSHAMRLEKFFSGAGIASRMIPVPRHLSSDCGVCLRINRGDLERAKEQISLSGIEIQGIHDV